MIFRVTFGFAGAGVGWSETHAARGASDQPADLASAATLVAQKRASFLGREFAIVAIRISRYSDNGGLVRAKGVFPIKMRFENPDQTAVQAAEPADVALIGTGYTNLTLAPAGFAANVNRTFLGAPADKAVNNAGVVDQGQASLGASFGQWRSAMLAGVFGWLANNTILDAPIASISQLGNGKVELVLQQAALAPLVAGTVYSARIRRVNGGSSPLNGQVIVRASAPNILTTQEVIGIALAQVGGDIRVYSRISPFVPYSDIVLNGTVGEHKRGRPFGSPPGRAKKRVRG